MRYSVSSATRTVIRRSFPFRGFREFVLLGAIVATPLRLLAGDPISCGCQNTAAAPRNLGPWRLQDSVNFCVCCPSNMDRAAIGRTCEALRLELSDKWLGDEPARSTWRARCYVVVHPSIASYVREVGEAGRATLGSSLIKTDHGRVVSRRIDLRGDAAEPLRAALPHEMTHVVLADAFAGEELPRWADEGMAMQADPPEKLAGHDHDFDAAVSEHRVFHLSQLLSEQDYPAADRRMVFYGESLSIVRYLVARRTAADFVRFLHLTAKLGNDASLKEVYGIQDLAQLEHLWRSQTNLALR
jgi:hypothetical protein